MEKYVEEWQKKAEKDLKSAKILIENDASLTDIICFLCQQSVEKQLKTFLVAKNKRFGKTHNIAELLKLCIDIDKSFE